MLYSSDAGYSGRCRLSRGRQHLVAELSNADKEVVMCEVDFPAHRFNPGEFRSTCCFERLSCHRSQATTVSVLSD